MSKMNLQVRLPEEINNQINRLAPESRSSFVREAIEEKIQKEKNQRMEKAWIEALKAHPDKAKEDEAWLKAQSWESK